MIYYDVDFIFLVVHRAVDAQIIRIWNPKVYFSINLGEGFYDQIIIFDKLSFLYRTLWHEVISEILLSLE
jgi:hypothetical protein